MSTVPDQAALEALAGQVAAKLLAAGQRLATAESCTGGWVAMTLTALAGSSVWFERGVVTYANEAKMDLLGVPAEVIETSGAVSEATAAAMAAGVLTRFPVDRALSITGIAGPGGGSPEKPVGTVCFGWASRQGLRTTRCCFEGNRQTIRAQAVQFALEGLLADLAATPAMPSASQNPLT